MIKALLVVVTLLFILGGFVYSRLVGPITLSRLQPSLNSLQHQDSSEPMAFTVEEVIGGLSVPWSIVFTSPDRILIAERNGAIKQLSLGSSQLITLYQFRDVRDRGEEGLMGLAMHPHYENNRWLFACYASQDSTNQIVRVVRLIDQQDRLEFDRIIIDNIPSARNHAGCRVKFGPDNKLYITTGDASNRNIAQDLSNLGGKILRINEDGSFPEDNPFPNSPVYSLGHRNSQGIAWHPQTHNLYSTEHGPSGFDGPGGGDEVNLIRAGANYGWPTVSHEKTHQGMEDPLLVFTPAVAPASAEFYNSTRLPKFTNNLFFGGLRGEGLFRVVISDDDPSNILSWEKLITDVGRVRDVAMSPDGHLYFTTSNTDGRGNPRPNDDKLFRLVPKD